MPSVFLTAIDSSMDPVLLGGVDDVDDEDNSFVGVHNKDTSFTGVPVPNTTIATNADDNLDTESDHNSIICTHHMSYIWTASLSHALLLQAISAMALS